MCECVCVGLAFSQPCYELLCPSCVCGVYAVATEKTNNLSFISEPEIVIELHFNSFSNYVHFINYANVDTN